MGFIKYSFLTLLKVYSSKISTCSKIIIIFYDETHQILQSLTLIINNIVNSPMKVVQLQRHHSMFETQLGINNGYKKIQNYMMDLANILGVGNFSKVYRGINQLNNQVCAIKVVEMERMKSPSLVKLLQSECEILKTLKHPNILNCIQIFKSKNNCYIITDLCNQGDLQSLIRKKGPLDESQSKKIIYQIFSGLHYLSEMRIIHRDFKVANIFMNNGVAKIADFGFAKRLKHPDQVFTDINIGSPIYMSPQSLLSNRYGSKTDVWAFGVFLYEILHGDTPLCFCQSQTDLKNNITKPIKQSAMNPYLSSQLKNLILRCLQVDERKRISMAEMGNHPYIIQLKQLFQPRNSNKALKVSESTMANSRLQMVEKWQGKTNLQSFVDIHNEPQSSQNPNQLLSPQRNIHVIKHKNDEQSILKSNQRISLRSHSVDNTPLSIKNIMVPGKLAPLHSIEGLQYTVQSPKIQSAAHQKNGVLLSGEIMPTHIINSCISFAQCVHMLHYCRLVYKCVTLTLKQNCHLDSNVHLVNWLLSLLKQISNKQNNVKFDGERANFRQKKLKDVIYQYQSKYMNELRQFVSSNPLLNIQQIRQKIKDQILVLIKILEVDKSKNSEILKVLMYLDYLRQATALLNFCVQTQDFSSFGKMKIEDFLGKVTSTLNVNIEIIKSNALA